LRFEMGKLEQALQESAEEALKYKQRLAKLEHKARRMTDVRFFCLTLRFSGWQKKKNGLFFVVCL